MGWIEWRRGRVGILFVLALFALSIAPAPTGAEEDPVSLVDWLNARGQDAHFEARAGYFRRYFPSEAYRGTAEQNLRLLAALDRGQIARPIRPPRRIPGRLQPVAPRHRRPGAGRRTIHHEGWRIVLDTGRQVLSLDAPKDVQVVARRGPLAVPRADPRLHATLPPATGFVSAAMLAQKAKIFDDGLYAAIELAAQRGHGRFRGKQRLLRILVKRLKAGGAAGESPAVAVVNGAQALGDGWTPTRAPSWPVAPAVGATLRAFWADAKRSKPLGFYTWSPTLASIFRQDRMLQTPLAMDGGLASVVAALRYDAATRTTYEAMLELAEGLTNPFAAPDLVPLLDGKRLPPRPGPRLLPPSRSHESDLARRLWGRKGAPAGANLMDELVRRIRTGDVDLTPRENAGWYDHQTYALEALLRPEATVEASRLVYAEAYRKHLEQLFRGVLALMRETHIKQLATETIVGAARPRAAPLVVGPRLTVEPLATHYERRAAGYAFVRGVLEQAFGEGSLAGLRRRTVDGWVATDLQTELHLVESLFRGAAATARIEVGLDPEEEDGLSVHRATFETWRALLAGDPDLGRDVRMMVPVFYDHPRRRMKVWVFLGWSDRPIDVAYRSTPPVLETKKLTGADEDEPQIQFTSQRVRVAYPVTAEVYVDQLLDREEFRAHCDRFETRTEILRNLR